VTGKLCLPPAEKIADNRLPGLQVQPTLNIGREAQKLESLF
jgi:hypothetical protein